MSEETKKEKEDLEISDGEAPDVEDAKRNLRSQAEKKRKAKKTVVQGVAQDVIIDTPTQEGDDNVERSNSMRQPQSQPNNEEPKRADVQRPGLTGDDAPASEMDDSALNASNSMQ